MIRNFLLICLLGCGISLATAGNPPFFTTGTAVNEKGELLMTQKGTRQLDVFAADGKTLLRSYPFKETPTGVLLDGDKAYVTTFRENRAVGGLVVEVGTDRSSYSYRFGSLLSDILGGQEAYLCMQSICRYSK